jgi:bromodomain adjacent to zinc finger domain protein 1A
VEEQNEYNDSEVKIFVSEKQKTNSRRSKRTYEESEDSSDEMPVKKFASEHGSRRLSNRISRRSSLETPAERRASKRSMDIFDTISLATLIDDIIKHKHAWPFTKPVSINEVPDYFEVIKNPMDFSKIKSKLNLGSYSSNEQVMRDIELVFSNCDLYNNGESEIFQ